MPNILSHFTDDGVVAFARWLQAGAAGRVPSDLLSDPSFSTPIGQIELSDRTFDDRYSFGEYLVSLLSPFDKYTISYNRNLWTWLAAYYFEQICPPDESGLRQLRREYAYILDSKNYFRHLVRMPWYLVGTHGQTARFLLTPLQTSDPAPLSRQSYLLDQLATRQMVIASPTLVGAAERLYSDPRTGRPIRGTAGARGRGSPRRLAIVANQLSLTFDIRDMPVERFLKLLPEEFSIHLN